MAASWQHECGMQDQLLAPGASRRRALRGFIRADVAVAVAVEADEVMLRASELAA